VCECVSVSVCVYVYVCGVWCVVWCVFVELCAGQLSHFFRVSRGVAADGCCGIVTLFHCANSLALPLPSVGAAVGVFKKRCVPRGRSNKFP
jgi:hypothetical protein